MMNAERIAAMNADIQAFIAPMLPIGDAMDRAFQTEYRAAWKAAMAQVDHIRAAHGLVRCGDAPGWKWGE